MEFTAEAAVVVVGDLCMAEEMGLVVMDVCERVRQWVNWNWQKR